MEKTFLVLIGFLGIIHIVCVFGSSGSGVIPKIVGVRFLLTVNDTWDPDGCIATIATPMMKPGNKSGNLMVGECDHGPLNFSILQPGMNNNKYTVSLTFHSSVIEDAAPPTCVLSWNGTYLVPKSQGKPDQDLLPSCFTADSREGNFLTYYWFHILDWQFASDNIWIYH